MSRAEDADAEAAAWLARLQGPDRTSDTDSALKTWLRADIAHRQAFERATEIWDLIPGAAGNLAVTEQPRRKSARHSLVAVMAMLLIAIVGGTAALVLHAPVYETPVGGQQVAMLPDGSRVSLNTDTRLVIHFSEGERLIVLERGEAMFEVAHNPARPFVVQSGDERVRALGTTFLVRRRTDAGIAVTLLQGRVEVAGPSQRAILSPGERLTLAPAVAPAVDRPAMDSITAWRRGEIIFEDASLGDAVTELNRYSQTKIVLADPSLAVRRVSGVFSTGDVAEVANALASVHRLRVIRTGDEIRLGP